MIIKLIEIEKKKIVYKTVKLKKQKKAKLNAFLLADKVENKMPNTFLMSNQCIINLSKKR